MPVRGQATPLATRASSSKVTTRLFTLVAKDGTPLVATVFLPETPADGTLPAVIFLNSWALGSYEYVVQAASFAREGYIALSYATRGFGGSGGLVNVGGPEDLADLSSAIDWLEGNTPVDRSNIGITGISYGGGISLLGASLEPRIKTAVSMSGFPDLGYALDGNDSPRLVWGLILLGSGYALGQIDPATAALYAGVVARGGDDKARDFAKVRSAATYVDALNAAGKPLYISNNLSDDLFQPNPVLDYFARLTVPKKLDLNRGEHATAELSGLVGLDNDVWNNVHAWFDHWLKGAQNGVMDQPAVSLAYKLGEGRVALDGWPSSTVSDRVFYLQPRGVFSPGGITDSAGVTQSSDVIFSGLDTLATSGFPLLSSALEAHTDVRTVIAPAFVDPLHGLVYQSDSLSDGLRIRGKALVHLPLASSNGKAGLVAYLYDVDGLGLGTLLTHGVASFHDGAPGAARDLEIDLSALAHDVAPGHRIALAVDTADILYAPPTLEPYAVEVFYSQSQRPTLTIQAGN